MIDVDHQISSVERRIGSRTLAAGEARTLTISRVYDTTPEDLWDACTNPERIPRWFLPVSGDLRPGGRYAFEGNASGTIERCEAPHSLDATWEYGGQTSWVEVRLTPEPAGGTRFALEHIAQVEDEIWAQYGPGAVGVGWDGAVMGLTLHLASGGEPVDRRGRSGLAGVGRGPGVHPALERGVGRGEHRLRHRPRRGARGRGAHHGLLHRRRPDQASATTASTSTGMPKGSSPAPIADRAWRPALAPQLQDQVAEAVDDGRRHVEALGAAHEAERLDPGRHAVEVSELLLERGEHRQAGRSRRLVGLLDGDLAADAAGDEHPVAVERPVARDVREVAVNAHERERQPHAGRRGRRGREREAELSQPVLRSRPSAQRYGDQCPWLPAHVNAAKTAKVSSASTTAKMSGSSITRPWLRTTCQGALGQPKPPINPSLRGCRARAPRCAARTARGPAARASARSRGRRR